jgi:hypothetical protein
MITLPNILFIVIIIGLITIFIEWYKTKNYLLFPLVIYFGIYVLLDIIYRLVKSYADIPSSGRWVLLVVKDIFVILIIYKIFPLLISKKIKQSDKTNS